MNDDSRLPAVVMAISVARSPDVDRRDAEWCREMEAAGREFLAALDAAVVARGGLT